MPIVQIDPNTDRSPHCEPCENVPGKIVTAQVREQPGEKNKGKFYVDIGVNFKAPESGEYIFAHTRPFGAGGCSLVPDSGSSVRRILSQLGQNPDLFETDDNGNIPALVGMDVLATVGKREYQQDDQTRFQNFIKDLMKA